MITVPNIFSIWSATENCRNGHDQSAGLTVSRLRASRQPFPAFPLFPVVK